MLPGFGERTQHLVQVQIGAADIGRGDLDDGVGGFLILGSATVSTRTSRLPCHVTAFMVSPSALPVLVDRILDVLARMFPAPRGQTHQNSSIKNEKMYEDLRPLRNH
jgi:hypothetical protein